MSDTLTFPYLDLTGHDIAAILLLTDDQKWTLVERLLAQHDHDRGDIPVAWADTPLAAWCWLVLVINHLDFDPDQHHPLTTGASTSASTAPPSAAGSGPSPNPHTRPREPRPSPPAGPHHAPAAVAGRRVPLPDPSGPGVPCTTRLGPPDPGIHPSTATERLQDQVLTPTVTDQTSTVLRPPGIYRSNLTHPHR